jgi:hypothetical protein
MDSYIPGSVCPFCSAPGRTFSLAVFTADNPIRDRLFIAAPECTHCQEAYRCPECFGSEKKRPDDCRFCPCARCCYEAVEFANGVKSGEISLWQAVKDLAEKRGAEPGPMAEMMERDFEDKIPF